MKTIILGLIILCFMITTCLFAQETDLKEVTSQEGDEKTLSQKEKCDLLYADIVSFDQEYAILLAELAFLEMTSAEVQREQNYAEKANSLPKKEAEAWKMKIHFIKNGCDKIIKKR